MIDRFGKRRVLRALTKRKFRNKRRVEERKTGQKNMGFKKGGKVEEGLLIMIEEKKRGGKVKNKREKKTPQEIRRKLGVGAALGKAAGTLNSPKQAEQQQQALDRMQREGRSGSNREKTEWEKKQELRKKAQERGGNMIFMDEWDKIDPGFKKHMFHKGGIPTRGTKSRVKSYPTQAPRTRKYPERKQISVKKEIEKRMKKETPRTYKIAKGKLGMLRRHLHKKRIEKELSSRPEHLERPKVKLAGGGISGKSTVGELKKKYGSLKKGIRLKGKGSSFIEEYKKRVYGRAKGGSMVQGPMKRARGSGAAIKGTRFQGTF